MDDLGRRVAAARAYAGLTPRTPPGRMRLAPLAFAACAMIIAGCGSTNTGDTSTAPTQTQPAPVVHHHRKHHAAPAPTTATDTTPAPAPATTQAAPPQASESVGSSSHAGDQQFCTVHQCIGNFQGEGGTIVQCSDGTYSHAGGISGSCSHHGGAR